VDWIPLAQDRNQCRDLVNTVMNLRVTASQEGPSYMALVNVINNQVQGTGIISRDHDLSP